MRYYLSLVLVASALAVPGDVLAHGVPLSISIDGSGRLFSELGVTYDHHDSALAPFPSGAPTVMRGTIGFYPKFGVVPAGTVLTVDATGSPAHPAALLFWGGGSVEPAPTNLSLTRSGISMDISPNDTFVAGGALPAYDGLEGGHSSFTASIPIDAPIGLYGVGFQVSSPGYETSETFWAILNNGVTDPAAIEQGLAAITAAVPEPSSLALAISALLAGLAASIRRR